MESYIEKRKLYLEPALELRKAGFSCGHIAKIYPVSSETIRRWSIKFASDTPNTSPMKNIPVASEPVQEKEKSADVTALEQRIKELEAQLKKESIRADFYDEMINVAEAKFNIPIRKKAGTKQ